MSAGVPAGASRANQELNSKPTRPDSPTVGTSAYCGRRLGVETASSLTRLLLVSEFTVARPWKATGSPKALRSTMAMAWPVLVVVEKSLLKSITSRPMAAPLSVPASRPTMSDRP
ncbi:MAG: hypothetical protein RLZZ584_1456 [Pseudomonadota bacterium]|jgi:hypothetical protein